MAKNEKAGTGHQQSSNDIVTYGLLLALTGSLLLNLYQLTVHNRDTVRNTAGPEVRAAVEQRLRTSLAACRQGSTRKDSVIHSLEHTLSTLESTLKHEKSTYSARH